ncbi:hypothetical protein [Alloprevotella rava]|uniref:Uncharacterized protein n=1 Tax=Alloprevotella rava TaxID=671218 RepID=A0A7W5UEU5_9BACT|nr:hypothetical protein [Alloprevotella rava]MBB3702839.1 hypothetical protein [Alloprevotella rava]
MISKAAGRINKFLGIISKAAGIINESLRRISKFLKVISKKGEGLNCLLPFFIAPSGRIMLVLLLSLWFSNRCKKSNLPERLVRKKVLGIVQNV